MKIGNCIEKNVEFKCEEADFMPAHVKTFENVNFTRGNFQSQAQEVNHLWKCSHVAFSFHMLHFQFTTENIQFTWKIVCFPFHV